VNAPDLHCHSTYSILDGFGTPKEIVKRAKELKWDSVAITEHGHLMSAVDFYKAARAEKINPIIGCEFYVVPDDILGVKTKDARLGSYHLTVLALSMEGYQNLVAWTTFAHQRENFYYRAQNFTGQDVRDGKVGASPQCNSLGLSGLGVVLGRERGRLCRRVGLRPRDGVAVPPLLH
jgi:DNA polymerase III alpha subunit